MNFLDKTMIIAFILLFSFGGLNAFDVESLNVSDSNKSFQNLTLNIVAIFLIFVYIFFRLTYKINRWNKNTTLNQDFYKKDKN
tara:strand:- start:14262 stop:14510 length:249 start_codon:yes stop_codon:yes gene_type:complete